MSAPLKFNSVSLLAKISRPDEIPPERLPEIAVAGRSNVGKSTLLNHLFRKNLAKTSNTPGRTRALFFFLVDERLVLVDLPGYGYAAVPLEAKAHWGKLIDTYLHERENLKILLCLIDSRREPSQEEHDLLEWARYHDKRAIIVATKIDKLKKAEREKRLAHFEQQFGVPVFPYSTTKNLGRNQLIACLQRELGWGS